MLSTSNLKLPPASVLGLPIHRVRQRKRPARQIVVNPLEVSNLTPCEAMAESLCTQGLSPFHVSDRIQGKRDGFDHGCSHATR